MLLPQRVRRNNRCLVEASRTTNGLTALASMTAAKCERWVPVHTCAYPRALTRERRRFSIGISTPTNSSTGVRFA